MKDGLFLSTIPFSGFYGSLHDSELDSAFERMTEDHDCTGVDCPPSLFDRAFGAVNWADVRQAYAADYAAAFLQWLGLGGKFESMTSPRFYNFETDRVFVELTRDDVARVFRMARPVLDKAARERFTSRSGFISHYDPDWRSWGPLADWDHNQIGTLVAAAAAVEHGGTASPDWDGWAEYSLMEDAFCNGSPDDWIHAAGGEELGRVLDVLDYLRGRARREVKTEAQRLAKRRAENRPFEGTPLGGLMH